MNEGKGKSMNKVVLTVIILALLGIGLYYSFFIRQKDKGDIQGLASWKEFTPQSRLFEVELPGTPQYAKDYLTIPNSDKKRRYDMYASEKLDGTVFLVSMITYPPESDISSPEAILRQNIEELAYNKGGNRVSHLSKSSFQGYEARDFTIDNPEFHVEGKAVQDDHTVYMLTYITRKGEFDPDEYKYFVSSFKILNKEAGSKQK
jgi:hypothetical protein